MGWRESVVDLARRCNMDADELDNWLTLTKQGYECLSEDLGEEPKTKEGNETLTALRNQLNRSHPDLAKITKKLAEVETMRVGIRTYPLINCVLVERILASDEISEADLDQLKREVDHIIGQDRARRKGRGASDDLRDWLIIDLVGIWINLTNKIPLAPKVANLSAKQGGFLDFACGAAILIGAEAETDKIPKYFEKIWRIINQDLADTEVVLAIREKMISRIERNKE